MTRSTTASGSRGWLGLPTQLGPALLTLLLSACSTSASEASRASGPVQPAERGAAEAPASPARAALPRSVAAPSATAPAEPLLRAEAPADVDLFAGTTLPLAQLETALAGEPLRALHPVGSTSTVFRAALRGASRNAAFKAETARQPRGPQSEIAAYRLARLLGLSNVPPAVSRRVPLSTLKAELDPDAARKWPLIAERLTVGRDGSVFGASIHWIEDLRDLELDTAQGRERSTRWLTQGTALSEAEAALAAQLSTLVAFDYLIGNWDRYSGGNLKGDATGRVLYMRDHDAAFARRLSESLHRRLLEPVLRTQRFSAAFHRALRALTRDDLKAELARDPGFPRGDQLDERRIAEVFDRRETLRSHIAALIEEYGAERVLCFP